MTVEYVQHFNVNIVIQAQNTDEYWDGIYYENFQIIHLPVQYRAVSTVYKY
jgi:hypothetical protein